MSNEGKNAVAWRKLFQKYNIFDGIEKEGCFYITADQIKEYREPRLMAKFDHSINLPKIFAENELSILPVSRNKYVIARVKAYQKFPHITTDVIHMSLPEEIQSVDLNKITSETVALNCAYSSGILADFLGEEYLYPTVAGRMRSGRFSYNVNCIGTNEALSVDVCNSQIEIDAAYEGINSLALLEAKRDISEDFLVRQLYYPYRTWEEKLTKRVRPIFLVYSNGVFNLYEYQFMDPMDYNSLVLIQQKNYSLEDVSIRNEDIQNVVRKVVLIEEPRISFPQANSFERIINLCELLAENDLGRDDVTQEYAFNVRQTNYYTDAAIYLGLVRKSYDDKYSPRYSLSIEGKSVLRLDYKRRQLKFCELILRHRPFYNTFIKAEEKGQIPQIEEIVDIMKGCGLYNVEKESTYERRASTISRWIYWIFSIINED